MESYQTSAIILLIASIQILSTSSVIVSTYDSSKEKDKKYNLALISIYLSVLSIIYSIFVYMGYEIPLLFQIWMFGILILDLIITILAIAQFGSQSVEGTVGWIIAIALCLILNGIWYPHSFVHDIINYKQ